MLRNGLAARVVGTIDGFVGLVLGMASE